MFLIRKINDFRGLGVPWRLDKNVWATLGGEIMISKTYKKSILLRKDKDSHKSTLVVYLFDDFVG